MSSVEAKIASVFEPVAAAASMRPKRLPPVLVLKEDHASKSAQPPFFLYLLHLASAASFLRKVGSFFRFTDFLFRSLSRVCSLVFLFFLVVTILSSIRETPPPYGFGLAARLATAVATPAPLHALELAEISPLLPITAVAPEWLAAAVLDAHLLPNLNSS